jgi:hypothetical protein
MFRDREKALQELQKQLLEEDESEQLPEEEEELPEEDMFEDDLPQEVYDVYTEDVRAYNSDTTDTALDEYSDDIYDATARKNGGALWFVLLTAAVLLLLSYILAKHGGFL